jgi:hypothetical protein
MNNEKSDIFCNVETDISNVNKDECPNCHEHVGVDEIYCANCGIKNVR